MNAKLTGIAMTAIVLCLAGCAHSGPHGGHSEKWYERHTAAMNAENKWCAAQSISTQMHSKSCERSGQAETVNMWSQAAASLGPTPTQMPPGTALPSPKTQ